MDYVRTGTQCSCDYCTTEMAKRGVEIRAVQARYEKQRSRWLKTATHILLRKHGARKVVSDPREVAPVLKDPQLAKWLDWRVERLAHFVEQVTAYAHKHGMRSSVAVIGVSIPESLRA